MVGVLSDDELKKIHGEDVELGIDNSKDDHLTEHDALKQASKDGIKFVDTFTVEGLDGVEFDSKEDAVAVAEQADEPLNVIQTRNRRDELDEGQKEALEILESELSENEE